MRRTRGSASASSRRPSDTVVISSAHCGRGCCTCCLDRRDSDAPMRRSPSPVGDRRRTAAGNRRSCPDAAAAGLGCRREATVLLAAFLSWAVQLGQEIEVGRKVNLPGQTQCLVSDRAQLVVVDTLQNGEFSGLTFLFWKKSFFDPLDFFACLIFRHHL